MCPRAAVWIVLSMSVDSPSSPSMAFELSLLDVRAVELSEHVAYRGWNGVGSLLVSHLPNGMRCFEQVSS